MKTQKTTRNMKRHFIWLLAGLMLIGLLGMASISLAAGDAWTKKADMPTARVELSTSVVNGKIYAIGGWQAFPNGTRTVEVYDPMTDTWTKKADDMPTARAAFSTSAVNGRIYAIGGRFINPAVVEEYDPAADTWTKKTDMPTARAAFSTSVVNGKIYAIGGSPGANAVIPTVEEYDPVKDKWTKKADMPTPRHGLSTSVVDGKIYAIGGWKPGAQPDGIQLSTVEEYDPATDTWTTKTDMRTERMALGTGVVNGKIYAIGGGGKGTTVFPTVEEYEPSTDRWIEKADMPTARLYLSASAVNGKIYAIGGQDANSVFPNVEEYTPEGWPFAVSPQGKLATTWGKIK